MAYHTYGHHNHSNHNYTPTTTQKMSDGREFMLVTKDLCAPGRALGDTIWLSKAQP
jgi:hypothetical protein